MPPPLVELKLNPCPSLLRPALLCIALFAPAWCSSFPCAPWGEKIRPSFFLFLSYFDRTKTKTSTRSHPIFFLCKKEAKHWGPFQ
ncbi:hypothetical protein BGZ63DRAFT_390463 [Mariannaea sp. PMI_226]|nr:hypothetical protein BGZ63DRAFT_390463 [Mariannaea sp. PMI_226]